MKNLLIATLLLTGTSAFAANPTPGVKTPQGPGYTLEVRYTQGSSNRKASHPVKLYITRDAEGRIVSVKRAR